LTSLDAAWDRFREKKKGRPAHFTTLFKKMTGSGHYRGKGDELGRRYVIKIRGDKANTQKRRTFQEKGEKFLGGGDA